MIILPIDVIRHVLEYIEDLDIDIRREYGIYSHINMRQFEMLNIGYIKYEKMNRTSFRITLPNLYGVAWRKDMNIADDYWYVQVKEYDDYVQYYIVKHTYRPNKYCTGRYEYCTTFYDYNRGKP